jgi:hypothetical protein
MLTRLRRYAAVSIAALTAALAFTSAAGAATTNVKIPADGFPAADLCNGDQIELHGTLHLVQQGEFVEDAPRQHVVGQLNSQKLTGVSVLTGQVYNVNLTQANVFNARVDGANVTTIETMMNVVGIGSVPNSQLQTVLHTTINANGEITTQFQNFHVHCQSD